MGHPVAEFRGGGADPDFGLTVMRFSKLVQVGPQRRSASSSTLVGSVTMNQKSSLSGTNKVFHDRRATTARRQLSFIASG